MAFIHAGLADVVIPSWIDRPPVNLGEKAHGKLKADNWLVLFSVFFPLIIPELWWGHTASRREQRLLLNFHDLVGATNILCSYTTSPAEADRYTEIYQRYLYSSKSLFPHLTTRPNHHYALHNGAQMKWWGPVIMLSENLYESHNGALQKIKTNNHMWEMDLMMLRQICRRGRLLAAISDTAKSSNSESPVVKAMQVLSPRVSVDSSGIPQLLPTEFNGSGPVMDGSTYELILRYWNHTYSPSYIRAADLRQDQVDSVGVSVHVLPVRAVQLTTFEHKTRPFSVFRKHSGNSSISFRQPFTGRKEMGFIQSVWAQVLQGEKWTFLVVQPHTALTPTDAIKTPYHTLQQFACSVSYTAPSCPQPQLLIEPKHIISHVPYLERPKGTFGIQKAITIFVDCLNRGRD
ncbi:hypothetical protein C8R44DRAFT_637606 [Mycena epipterygia]|nr:hypothetical protein C8R44DRAFT_637606 [Mycena epipterygia]